MFNKKEYNRLYQFKNRARIYAKHKEWIEKNKEQQKQYHKDHHKKWYQVHKEERQRQIKEYSKNHRKDNVKRTQKYVKANKEKVYSYGRKYNRTSSGAYRFTKSNAIKRGFEFSLSFEEFEAIIFKPCIYCGEHEKRIGIDRVDNSIGYTVENSAPCCAICNYMKKTHTKEDFLNHIKKIYIHNE